MTQVPQGGGVQPRVISKEMAAAYLSLSLQGFDAWVRAGRIPGPLPGTHRWDRAAIDRALDKHSGLTTNAKPSALDEWKAQKDARRA